MEPEKDVSEYLHEVNLQELGNCPLWNRMQEILFRSKETEFVVDMGTDISSSDNVVLKKDKQEMDLLFYIQVCAVSFCYSYCNLK